MTKPATPYQPYAAVHQNPQGEGDARPTALQIVQDCQATGALAGRTILITGCTAGIGIETARALYTTGARLFLTARDMTKISSVITDIVSSHRDLLTPTPPHPEALELHLDSLSSVRAAADEFIRRSGGHLDILIANAGVMACDLARTPDGFERQLGTNHFAHFLLARRLEPVLLASSRASGRASRVVAVSSAAHRMQGIRFADLNWRESESEYDRWKAYGQSKTANIYMAAAMNRRFGEAKNGGGGEEERGRIVALAVHPGGIRTDLSRYLPEADSKAIAANTQLTPFYKSAEQGAATTVWAALAEHFEDGTNGGRYVADCGESAPMGAAVGFAPGYAAHVYDEAAEEKLWKLSCEAVGVSLD